MKDDGKRPSITDLIDEVQDEIGVSDEVAYWTPLTDFIHETIRARYVEGLSQADLAERMDTKQAAVSRFEHLGRKPSYDFVVRLAHAFGHQLGLTVYGEFMAVVDERDRAEVASIAEASGKKTRDVVSDLLREGIRGRRNLNNMQAWLTGAAQDTYLFTADSLESGGTGTGVDDTSVAGIGDDMVAADIA
ncbi:MAG: helix-turn-helix domain-containing protein [Spirochaeta sp.]|jgi:transcriptional regulator with XRE-family HTH domain|nr:helix-turn-helix domain-containing protein [Spirochaeta sp.]